MPSITDQNKAVDSKAPATEKSSSAIPTISLPKGGGAIRGIGEKFAANPVTGTGSMTVPVATSPGRSGFGPQLSLAYDSGAGNGPFGIGWNLSLPSITRKTDKGLPRYHDDDDSDVFVLSGAEDLVPALTDTGIRKSFQMQFDGAAYTVQHYRPRIEGLFARIERWRNNATGAMHWRSISKDNITSLYGQTRDSRIADPEDPLHAFSWLLDATYDDKGNVVVYEYKAEDRKNVVPSLHEENREVTANRYLKRINYGNRVPYYQARNAPQPAPLPTDWAFQVVFDYGEHDLENPRVDVDVSWETRPDPFSSYRAGFETRTYRLCRRVLMFHHFPRELDPDPCLVRSTDFTYSHDERPDDPLNPIFSFIVSATQKGYVKTTTGYESKSLPPLQFAYTEARVDENVHFVDSASLENLPYGSDGTQYQWIDLDSEGLPGILTEQADAWFYKRNVSNLPNDRNGVSARFEAVELVATKPSLADLRGGQQLMDLAGEGQLCLVQFGKPMSGFHDRDQQGQWQPFTPFVASPEIDWKDPNLKFVDLNGDGHADILITDDEVFTWYPSRAKEGFGPAETVRKTFDEEKGPALVFADGAQSIYLADLSGDGLSDLVRIRNGEVCYWPNHGYGRFGSKITMDDAPVFDHPDQFDQKRIRLADIDGSGTTDIIYLGRDKIALYFNQSGNSWSPPRELSQFPATDNLAAVTIVDLLGNGTACIVWSSPLPADQVNAASRPMRYIDLMGGQKPHLLVSTRNNLGAETRVQYAASTRFYLQDRAEGNPWITKLPFPVHVIERVEVYDYVSQTRFVSLYRYHHGYFDGTEREFRGFGMVEQWDTESFSAFFGAGLFTETPATAGKEWHLPPVHTKTWLHNGAYVAGDNISRQFEHEYYKFDIQARLLSDTILPTGLTAEEYREACRALKGRVLRQEVYADDDTLSTPHPYTATEHAYRLRLIQPMGSNPHAVFYAFEGEALSYHYERNPVDPRIAHQITLEVDEFGNAVKSVAIGYPRRPATGNQPPHPPEQTQTLITYTENRVTNKPMEADWYRIGVPIETRTYELKGFLPADGPIFSVADFVEPNQGQVELRYDTEIAYEQTATSGRQRRLIERARTLYLKNDLSGPLALEEVDSLALPYQSYKVAFTPGLLEVFSEKISRADLATLLTGPEGRYQDLDGDGVLWIPSGLIVLSPVPKPTPVTITQDPVFARQHFYLPQASQDPFGNISRVAHDTHDLVIVKTEDALGNIVSSENDYRVMLPAEVTDANNNRAAVRFDALGTVVATAVMGKEEETDPEKMGDTLDDPTTRLEYDLFNWMQTGSPNFVHTFARELHGSANTRWQESISYSDGAGREVMRKVQAEPGKVKQLDALGNIIEVDTSPGVRWVGTGRVVFDNKGNPVKKYEPFFSATPEYETEEKLVVVGVTPILRYDPLGRLIRADAPNGTFSTVAFDPWQQITADENDTVLQSQWYIDRGSPNPASSEPHDPETRAAWLASRHADTPAFTHFDTLGRPFLTIADNGTAGKYETRVELDIEGNRRSVTDAIGRKVMVYGYNMLSTVINQKGMDAGERWMLNDVAGKPIYAWDNRDHRIHHEYDELQRLTNVWVQTGDGDKRLVERIVYGEGQSDDRTLNLRGKPFHYFDGAGVVSNNEHDFKGNLLSSARQLLQDYNHEVDWSQSPPLEGETFRTSTTYDALNRPVTNTTRDNSVTRPTYNEAGLLQRVDVNLRGAATATPFVTNIDYNARGQREIIERHIAGDTPGVVLTDYDYDPLTFRLTKLRSTRTTDNALLQDMSYTYDPVGNITEIHDGAQQTIYFNNQVVTPSSKYVYDALNRLVQAEGREHIGQVGQPESTWNDEFRVNLPHPNDGQAMRGYVEQYEYDEVGNLLRLIHQAANGGWRRSYAYGEPSLVEPGLTNNRLTSIRVSRDDNPNAIIEPYTHDEHGNMINMPHLPVMEWDYKDELHSTQRQVVNNGDTGEKTYYVYDAAGQRVRKINEYATQTDGPPRKKNERIYLGGFEIYREYNSSNRAIKLERETLHVMDDTRRIALVETKTVDSESPISSVQSLIRYELTNHLDSASLELDEGGRIISYEEYYPYGSTSYQAGRNAAEVSLRRYRYTGKERDEETGLYYHGARYYAAWMGRWTSCDPSGIKDGVNVYQYVRNNPIGMTDSTGGEGEDKVNVVRMPRGVPLCELAGGVSAPISQTTFDRKMAEIKSHPVYKSLSRDDKEVADSIISKAGSRDNRLYYAEKLLLLFDTRTRATSATSGANRTEMKAAVKEHQKQNQMAETQPATILWEEKAGRGGKTFLIDRSDLENIAVKIKVHLSGPKGDVEDVKALKSAIERGASTDGYKVYLEFTEKSGKDVFEVDVDLNRGAFANNWSMPESMPHELHHLLGLPDRYDFIEAHADNYNMSVGIRLGLFERQMDRSPDPLGEASIMGGGEMKPLGSGEKPLPDDICNVAQLPNDTEEQRQQCLQTRAKVWRPHDL